jgi:hypothetical protein
MSHAKFGPETHILLVAAGWHEDYSATESLPTWLETLAAGPDGFECFPAAESALRRFGGLHIVPPRKRGVDCAPARLDLDPTLGAGERTQWKFYVDLIGSRLYPLGEVGGGYYFFAIDELGRTYMAGDELYFAGATVEDGIEALSIGRQVRIIATRP